MVKALSHINNYVDLGTRGLLGKGDSGTGSKCITYLPN